MKAVLGHFSYVAECWLCVNLKSGPLQHGKNETFYNSPPHAGSAGVHLCSAVCTLDGKELSTSLGFHIFSFQLLCMAFL